MGPEATIAAFRQCMCLFLEGVDRYRSTCCPFPNNSVPQIQEHDGYFEIEDVDNETDDVTNGTVRQADGLAGRAVL